MPAFPDNSQGTPPAGGPKLSAAEFQTWKAQKDEAAAAAKAERDEQRREDIRTGAVSVEHLTGRELHEHHPELFNNY